MIGLRLAKLMRGGKGARREAERMVSEKIQAAAKAGASLMAGASSDEVVRQYRKRVMANAKRLGPAAKTTTQTKISLIPTMRREPSAPSYPTRDPGRSGVA